MKTGLVGWLAVLAWLNNVSASFTWVKIFEMKNGQVAYDLGANSIQTYFAQNLILRYDINGAPYSYYKRLTPVSSSSGLSLRALLLDTWRLTSGNAFHIDFDLYSSLNDALNNNNRWAYCNGNDNGVGFPRDCGRYRYVANKWAANSARFPYPPYNPTFAFYVYQEVTQSPTPSPTSSPTPSPTSSPTPSPTSSPTPSPTPLPTQTTASLVGDPHVNTFGQEEILFEGKDASTWYSLLSDSRISINGQIGNFRSESKNLKYLKAVGISNLATKTKLSISGKGVKEVSRDGTEVGLISSPQDTAEFGYLFASVNLNGFSISKCGIYELSNGDVVTLANYPYECKKQSLQIQKCSVLLDEVDVFMYEDKNYGTVIYSSSLGKITIELYKFNSKSDNSHTDSLRMDLFLENFNKMVDSRGVLAGGENNEDDLIVGSMFATL